MPAGKLIRVTTINISAINLHLPLLVISCLSKILMRKLTVPVNVDFHLHVGHYNFVGGPG